MNKINKIRFLKKGIKVNGNYISVWYSKGNLINYPTETITIYVKSYCDDLPTELNPVNNSDSQTDYFEKDRARIEPNNPFYADVLKAAA